MRLAPLNIPATVPAAKRPLLEGLVSALARVPGVEAVVLGGSYARGTQTETSDLDLGLYYQKSAPFALTAIRRIAEGVASRPPVVTGFYDWGPWVNGGAWIFTGVGKVDFLYRNIDQVAKTIQEAHRGISRHDYSQQPAYGFYSVIYLAETQRCLPLHDPAGVIAGLKARVAMYPPRLKEKIVADSLWSAEFTLQHARSFAAAGDVYNTAGCLTRVAANLTQVLFALNETYFMSDKQVMAEIAAFPLLPPAYPERLVAILAHSGAAPTELGRAVGDIGILWQEVAALTGTYRPQFEVQVQP